MLWSVEVAGTVYVVVVVVTPWGWEEVDEPVLDSEAVVDLVTTTVVEPVKVSVAVVGLVETVTVDVNLVASVDTVLASEEAVEAVPSEEVP